MQVALLREIESLIEIGKHACIRSSILHSIRCKMQGMDNGLHAFHILDVENMRICFAIYVVPANEGTYAYVLISIGRKDSDIPYILRLNKRTS